MTGPYWTHPDRLLTYKHHDGLSGKFDWGREQNSINFGIVIDQTQNTVKRYTMAF